MGTYLLVVFSCPWTSEGPTAHVKFIQLYEEFICITYAKYVTEGVVRNVL
jgi:hypothetical protein